VSERSDSAAQEDEARRQALVSPDMRVRLGVLERLAAEREPIETPLALAVVECLGVGTKALQRRAADVLRRTSDAARPAVLGALWAAVTAPEASRRWSATYVLGQLDILEPALVPALLEALGDRDGDRRWAAAALMVGCGTRHPTVVVPALREALRAPLPELRKMALYVLRDLAADVPGLTAELLAATRDDDVAVRLAALAALTRVAPPPPGACDEALRLARDDPNPGVRRAAVSALGKLGRGVPAAEVAVRAALDSADPSLRRAAEAARRAIDSAPTRSARDGRRGRE
jgi:HEAT repeat protein